MKCLETDLFKKSSFRCLKDNVITGKWVQRDKEWEKEIQFLLWESDVTDFKYLGSQMASSASDFKRRKALA